MTKQEFVDAVADKAGLTKRDAGAAVDAALDVIERTLVAGDSITFTGFGKFHVTRRAARLGVNPRTGEHVQISAANVPKFSAGSQLKKAVNWLVSGTEIRRSGFPSRGPPSGGHIPEGGRCRGRNCRLRLRDGVQSQRSRVPLDVVIERMFDYDRRRCSSRSTPPTGSSSSSRPAAGPFRRRTRPACSSRSRARPPPSPARCSTTSSPVTRASRGAAPRSGSRPRPARTSCSSTRTSSSSTSRRPACRRGPRGSARSARSASARSSSRTRSRRSSTRASPLPPAVAALTGHPARRAPRGAACRPRDAPLPRVRRRRRARRAQRALRPRVPRPRGRAPHRAAHRRAGRGHRLARAAAARRADAARRARGALALLRRLDRAVPPRAPGRARDGGDPRRPHRARAGARRSLARRPRRARRAARAAAAREALARRRRADQPGRLRLPRARAGCRSTWAARAQLRARLRSYFAGERQRPAVEAALGALERVEWRETGSELEAALEELRLLRELRPPANARGTRPDRHVYLRRRGARWSVTTEPTASRAAQREGRRPAGRAGARRPRVGRRRGGRSQPLRARLRRLARDQRFEDAARAPRPARGARGHGRGACGSSSGSGGFAPASSCPAGRPGFVRAYALAGGRVAAHAPRPARRGRGSPRSPALVAEAERAAQAQRPGGRRRAPARRLVPPPAAARAAGRPRSSGTRSCALVDGIPLAA